ncbi:MAG: FecR family protein [Bacteroidota bacterium]
MKDIFWELVTKYLSNEASETEVQELSDLMEGNKKYQEAFEDIAKKWHDSEDFGHVPFDVQRARTEVLDRISEKDGGTARKETKRLNFLIGVAAMLVLVLGLYHLDRNPDNDDSEWKGFVTAENEKLRILLPDSSVVWLNGNTSMSYNFSNPKERRLRLDGEAFFEVYRNEERPFTVTGPYFTTKVLGTSFNIDSKDEKEASVSVISGKVVVNQNKSEKNLFLERGHRAIFDKNRQELRKEESMAIANEMAWVHQKFIFKDLPMEKVLGYLSQNFGADFQVADEKLNYCLITGTFQNESLTNILTIICSSLDCEFTKTGNNTILLSGNGCEKKPEDIGTIPRLKTNK